MVISVETLAAVIRSAAAGAIDNEVIGATTAAAGTFTTLTASGLIRSTGGDVRIRDPGQFYWDTRAAIFSPADGVIRLTDNANTNFNRLQFGGTSASFPSIKRNGALFDFRLADDSAYAGIQSSTYAQVDVNAQAATLKDLSELTTIAAAATTDTAIQIPANSIVLGVSVRVTTLIPTAANFTVTGTSSGTAFQTGASVLVASGTTDVGTKSCPYLNGAAQTIRITPNLVPADNTGRVRVTIHYLQITAPTS